MSPTLGEVINKATEVLSGRLRVGLPGIIQSYDAATQTADVLPAPMPTIFLEDGSEATEAYPVIPHVKVQFPRGGRYRITFPVQAGDECWLTFADHSIDIWQKQGGQCAPIHLHEHDLSDAVALLGISSDPNAWIDAPTDQMTIGKDGGLTVRIGETTIDLGGGSTDFVAMAAKVQSELNALWGAIHAHIHPGVQTGAGSTGPSVTTGSAGAVGSTTIKVKG